MDSRCIVVGFPKELRDESNLSYAFLVCPRVIRGLAFARTATFQSPGISIGAEHRLTHHGLVHNRWYVLATVRRSTRTRCPSLTSKQFVADFDLRAC